MTKKLYLAGPMSNLPEFNFPAFFAAEEKLVEMGYEVFNPARHDTESYGADLFKKCTKGSHEEMREILQDKTPTYRDFMKVDLNWIIDNADSMAFLPGWENSKGVKAEKALAECLGLEMIYL